MAKKQILHIQTKKLDIVFSPRLTQCVNITRLDELKQGKRKLREWDSEWNKFDHLASLLFIEAVTMESIKYKSPRKNGVGGAKVREAKRGNH